MYITLYERQNTNLYGDITIAGEGLQILSVSFELSSKGSLTWRSYSANAVLDDLKCYYNKIENFYNSSKDMKRNYSVNYILYSIYDISTKMHIKMFYMSLYSDLGSRDYFSVLNNINTNHKRIFFFENYIYIYK